MINYRDLTVEGLVKRLWKNKVTIVDKIESFESGKFVNKMVADGNKIEFWQPVESVLTRISCITTKYMIGKRSPGIND
jgi:hypothetical protein